MKMQIGKYRILYYTLPEQPSNILNPIATVQLFDISSTYRGDVIFNRIHFPEEIIPGNFYDEISKTFQLRMHASLIGAVVSSLSSDVPCFILDYKEWNARLATDVAVHGGVPLWSRFVNALLGPRRIAAQLGIDK